MRTTQRKGDIATSRALARFTQMGFDVAIPFTESAPYDLVVDTGKELRRVQVRYAGAKEVDLRNIHSNAQGYVIRKTKPDDYDWLYIYTKEGAEYLIKKCLSGRRSVTPTAVYLIASNSGPAN